MRFLAARCTACSFRRGSMSPDQETDVDCPDVVVLPCALLMTALCLAFGGCGFLVTFRLRVRLL